MNLLIAQINFAVFVGLGSPDASVCSPTDIHYATRKAVTLMTKQMRAADTNQPLSLSATFTPTSSPHEVTALVGKSEIAWIERQEGTRWKPIRVVNKAFLENYVAAAAVYSDESNKTYIDFSTDVGAESSTVYRLWYDKDAVPTLKASETLIPDSFSPYPEMLAQNTLIAGVKLKIASAIENEEERRIIALKLEAWDGKIAQNMLELPEWRHLWKRYIHRNRTAQTQDRLPRKSGRGFYGS